MALSEKGPVHLSGKTKENHSKYSHQMAKFFQLS
jgi:hypothetical protein